MRIAMLATASAVAFVFAIGSVSAADQIATPKQFTTLKGVKAVPMSSGELSSVKGMDHHFFVTPPGTGETVRHDTDQFQDANGAGNFVDIVKVLHNGIPGGTGSGAPGYRGLILHACVVSGGVITGPTSATSVWCLPAS